MDRGWKFAIAVGLAVFLAAGAYAAAEHRPLSFLVGDGPYYAATAVSVLYDGDLDLRNQLRGGIEVHGRQIAIGPDGSWYPKHPILMPVTALPFLAVFGMDGLLLFNLLVVSGVAAAMAALARRRAGLVPAAVAVALLLGGTFFRAYVYNLSPDLFATLLVLGATLCLMDRRPGAAGLCLGAAVAAKFLLVVLVPIFALAVPAFSALREAGDRGVRDRTARAKGALRFAAGLVPAAAALLVSNALLFGSPWITSYDRGVGIEAGQQRLITHRAQFDQDPLRGLAGEIADPRRGLLRTAPVVLLAIPGLMLLWRRDRAEALLAIGVGLTLLFVLAPYRSWSASHYGNRFLMPAIALLAPAMALACERIGALLARGSRRASRRPGGSAPRAIERPAA
jgi:hypothetical protein